MGGQKRMSLSLYTLVKKEWAYTYVHPRRSVCIVQCYPGLYLQRLIIPDPLTYFIVAKFSIAIQIKNKLEPQIQNRILK